MQVKTKTIFYHKKTTLLYLMEYNKFCFLSYLFSVNEHWDLLCFVFCYLVNVYCIMLVLFYGEDLQ